MFKEQKSGMRNNVVKRPYFSFHFFVPTPTKIGYREILSRGSLFLSSGVEATKKSPETFESGPFRFMMLENYFPSIFSFKAARASKSPKVDFSEFLLISLTAFEEPPPLDLPLDFLVVGLSSPSSKVLK